mmetsp:Transcript_12799/g.21426  ORF Transcript_12799/g.21426 Transcript_12799/m.21426 type:complete len:105 (+) Transcript_12799:199-513(+)
MALLLLCATHTVSILPVCFSLLLLICAQPGMSLLLLNCAQPGMPLLLLICAQLGLPDSFIQLLDETLDIPTEGMLVFTHGANGPLEEGRRNTQVARRVLDEIDR